MNWDCPIPLKRWQGFRSKRMGIEAFLSKENFEQAALSELESGLSEHELKTLGRLLERGKKTELEVFIRSHGSNPLFDSDAPLEGLVGIVKADRVDLSKPATEEANRAILEGKVVHVLFQAGEASRFRQGPFYSLKLIPFVEQFLSQTLSSKDDTASQIIKETTLQLKKVRETAAQQKSEAVDFILNSSFGPMQPILIRAALRRIVTDEVESGRVSKKSAVALYKKAIKNQKILFFVSRRNDVSLLHDKSLRETFQFYGFNPQNLVTIEQELPRGLNVSSEGVVSTIEDNWSEDAVGHLYALIQAARTGGFTTYTESGRPIKPMELDAFFYLESRGASFLNIIRINDMDRHTVEIINPKSLAYALDTFEKGYVDVIETVANPEKQKGGTGLTFGNPDIHILTETHENSFPALSRAVEPAIGKYLEENKGQHPAYNAMRQWCVMPATRRVLREYGGRIVFVPRQKNVDGVLKSYIGVDMPMGDLSLLYRFYKSRMFQFYVPPHQELLIHDMKQLEHLPIALKALQAQLESVHVISAVEEVLSGKINLFSRLSPQLSAYGAPASEFNEN
ncbi:MAG: hypothetical protein ACKVQC_05425 [Elusimicrobiota bacterium]